MDDVTAGYRRRRGRPPRVEGQAATKRVWVFVTPTERAELEAVAKENGQTVSAYIRDVVTDAVAEAREAS